MAQDLIESFANIAYTPDELRNWIDGTSSTYIGEKYDSEVGWVHTAGTFRHGVDNAVCEYTYAEGGARRMVNHADRPCRINTYGDSFTHCDQVSDGETWQEYLAAHLGEPVRNFGTSGHSFYQMYRRMRREEERTSAEILVFNVYSDDHFRSLFGWGSLRYLFSDRAVPHRPSMPYVKANPSTGEFVEYLNPCPTIEALQNLGDPIWAYDRFKDDDIVQILLAQRAVDNNAVEVMAESISLLAQKHGLEETVTDGASLSRIAGLIYTNAALFASMRIVDLIEEHAHSAGKKVIYVLSHVERHAAQALAGATRFDQPFVDYLLSRQLSYVDLLDDHTGDFAQFDVDIDKYLRRYYIGHYNPAGNQFTAFALKDTLVKHMSPPPLAYSTSTQ